MCNKVNILLIFSKTYNDLKVSTFFSMHILKPFDGNFTFNIRVYEIQKILYCPFSKEMVK